MPARSFANENLIWVKDRRKPTIPPCYYTNMVCIFNSKKELKTKVCQTHDEIFVSSFSVQHKNLVFGHL